MVQDGVDVGEQEDQVAGVSGVEADAGDLVVAAGLGDQGHGGASWGYGYPVLADWRRAWAVRSWQEPVPVMRASKVSWPAMRRTAAGR